MFFANNSYCSLICPTMMGSTIQMASSPLDVNPGGHLEANNWFSYQLEAVRNLKMASKLVKFEGFLPITAIATSFALL